VTSAKTFGVSGMEGTTNLGGSRSILTVLVRMVVSQGVEDLLEVRKASG